MSGAEIWDVTDEHGVSTGVTFRRGASGWPVGRFHVVAAMCVMNTAGKVLLTRRGPTKDFAGMWEFPGGSALAGESSAHAAARELLEEIGLRVPVGSVHRIGRFVEDRALFDLHLVEAPVLQEPRPDGVEVTDFEWVDLIEVDRRRLDREFADPWDGRLRAFWSSLTDAVESLTGSLSDQQGVGPRLLAGEAGGAGSVSSSADPSGRL